MAPGSRFDKEAGGDREERYYHLVLLAENDLGYHNLMKIVSRGFTEGYYYRPRVDMEILERYHEDIIALSACLAGEVQRNIARGMYEEGKAAALRYQQIFGEGNFFLELQDHGIPQQKMVNQGLVRMAGETGIELVATNDVHYTYAEDEKPHDILLCIQTGKKIADEDRMRHEGGQYYIKSEEEMELFPYAPQALENTQKIAQRCNVEIEFGVTKLPKFDVPEGYTSWEYLNKLCREGFEKRYPDAGEDLKERLEYELSTIHTMGYVDYFLIVWDFIRYARDHGIMVGPGRGSAAGEHRVLLFGDHLSIDPIKYQLLFERFLNPERVSMPDIDVDFCFERRQEVIDYVVKKIRKRPGGTDRHLWYSGGPRCDPGCGPGHGPALCFCGQYCQDGSSGIKYYFGESAEDESGTSEIIRGRSPGQRTGGHVHASGRTSQTYFHARGGRRHQPEGYR